MKAVIFGINGQDGHYLSELLKKNEVDLIGVSRSVGGWIKGDVSDFSFVENLIKEEAPDFIFHFAANSTADHNATVENHKSISDGSLYILESVLRHSNHTKVFLPGSAMQFLNDGRPIDEKAPFYSGSSYAAERIYSTFLGRYYRSLGVPVYIGFLFHHDSPLRSERHINKKIAETVKRIAAGEDQRLKIGDINARKEFNYAGDIVNAIWTLVNQNNIFEAVIGSGEAHSIKEWVEYCFEKVGLDWRNFTEEDKSFVPKHKILVSNPKIIRSLGWTPQVNFQQMVDLMME